MDSFADLLQAWSDAERRGAQAALDGVLAADFRGDGPLGYVLDREEWLARYDARAAFSWHLSGLYVGLDSAVAVGVQTLVAHAGGLDVSGEESRGHVARSRAKFRRASSLAGSG